MPKGFASLRAAQIDGRTQNIRYRQHELQQLHKILLANITNFREAIQLDTGSSAVEVDIEISQALSDLRKHYLSLDFDQELENEYRVAHGKEHVERRVGAGTVYIVPGNHSLLYSVIAPLSAALTAGNCVIVELNDNHQAVSSLLRKVLTEALDVETFAVSECRPSDPDALTEYLQVLQTHTDEPSITTRCMSPSSALAVAVVDRTASIEEAAKAIVTARFSFGGRSPYAPDLVLVNEFVADKFMKAVVQHSSRYLAEQNGHAGGKSGSKSRERPAKDTLGQDVRGDVQIIVSGRNGTVVRVTDRQSNLLRQKIQGCLLPVLSVTSTDDAIDIANKSGHPLAASYVFASPSTAKYLTQFIDAYVSHVNQIPAEMLVGPIAPLGFPVSLSTRYSRTMFEVPRGILIQQAKGAERLTKALQEADSNCAISIRKDASTALPPTGQKQGGAIAFFEQGLITGSLVIGIPIAASVATLGYYCVALAVRKIRR